MGRGKGGKGKGKGEEEPEVEVKHVWLGRNLETGKAGLYVEEDTGKGKKFKPLGKAKGGDKHN